MVSRDGEKTKVVHSERRTVAGVSAISTASATSPNPQSAGLPPWFNGLVDWVYRMARERRAA